MTIWTPDIERLPGPKYKAIATALADDVASGRLAPGARLPTHRELADILGVTVGTVTRGYAEAERRGLIGGQVGRGTFVLGPPAPSPIAAGIFHHVPPGFIDLGLNTPIYPEDPDLGAALGWLAKRSNINELLCYHTAPGLDRHRRAGAVWAQKYGVSASPESLLISAGAQHGIAVVLSALLRPGDALLAEELTYPGMKAAAELFGLRPAPVDMDENGLLPESLERACRETGARVLYLMPTLHNPTTSTLDEPRRREIIRIAEKYDLVLIEDDVHRLLHPDPPPPLAALAPERTVLIAGTSKLLAGGLRVAYILPPPRLFPHISRSISTTIWMAPPLMAEIAALWIEDGTADRTIRRKREEAARRQKLAADVLGRFSFQTHPNSYHLWLRLPPPWRSPELAHEMEKRGVSVIPSQAFVADPMADHRAVRVSLSSAPDRETLSRGLTMLADLLDSSPPPPPPIV